MASPEAALERVEPVASSTPFKIWMRLLRHHLRLLAPSGVIWIIGLVSTAAIVAGVWIDTFPTQEERIALAQSVEGNPAFEAMFGKATQIHTIEGFTMWRAGGPLFPAIVIWGLLAATRLARIDEDKGHDELLLGGVVSRRALFLSALIAPFILIAIYAVLTIITLRGISDITFDGSLRFALGMSGGFMFFAALGALLVQITPSRSVGLRFGLGIIGATLAVRILSVLEPMPGWLPWLTPFGWFSEIGTQDVGSNVPFLLFGTGTLVLAVAALNLAQRREIHGSLLLGESETSGPHPPYESFWQHEVRQDMPALIGFGGVGIVLAGIFGMVANDFVEFVADFPAFAAFLAEFGLTDPQDPSAYIGLIITMLVLIPTLYAAGHVAAMRDDEASGRLAVLLVLPLERHRWLLTNTLVGLLGITVISLLVGFSAMVGTLITGTMLDPMDALRAGLNLIPIAVLFVGLGVLIFGIYPQLTGPLVYTLMLSSFLLVLLDAFLDIPGWIIALSPFEYQPSVPGEEANLTVSALFLAFGLIGFVIGGLAFRRRDLMMD
jgi:ABC-2 type transport system permease protein